MYNPPAFVVEDEKELRAIMAAASLPVLVSPAKGGGLLATHLPLLMSGADKLVGHVAKANFHWRDFDPDQDSLVIFTAAEGYVSPSAYPSKQAHGKVVPTWNYSAVHATGRLAAIDDAAAKLEIVSALTDRHEAGRAKPWSVADAPADYMISQLKGIVGLQLTITRLEGKAKLSQNRSAPDREGVLRAMETGNPALAAAMKRGF